MSGSFVVDASATLKLLVEEAGTDYARIFFGHLKGPKAPVFYAPDLLYVECANTLWKYVVHHRTPSRQAQGALETLMELDLEVIPAQLIIQEALLLGIRCHISVYDACYLALAQQCRSPLVTEDLDLIRKVGPHVNVPLHTLAEAVLGR
ncbi:MAG: type II toxin-antitoxin system VapC family toxin [Candidatus Omnitrophica bacterium]|nr:type II toxin-antitoxin system VapC family toxin [Candidatus Omnitrophota bacterium]